MTSYHGFKINDKVEVNVNYKLTTMPGYFGHVRGFLPVTSSSWTKESLYIEVDIVGWSGYGHFFPNEINHISEEEYMRRLLEV